MRLNRAKQCGTALWLAALVAASGVTGCASGGSGGGSSAPANMITSEQVEAFPARNAYELIQRYKSRWLRPARNQNVTGQRTAADRGGGNDQDVLAGQELYAIVFLDGQRFGGLDSLTQLDVSAIESIEYIDARSATTQYGTGYLGGIINVHSKGLR